MHLENGNRQEILESLLLNAADVAALLRISKRYAYHLMASGTIPSVHIGRAVRVHEADLNTYLESLKRNSG